MKVYIKEVNHQIKCEVLVIGAGPAGGSAATAAAGSGADVVLVDRRRRIGEPARCAGLVSAGIDFITGLGGIARHKIKSMVTELPDGEVVTTASPAYILPREILDQQLAQDAACAGASVITGCRAHANTGGADCSLADGRQLRIDARVIIGADGPDSTTARLIGNVRQEKIFAAQWNVPLMDADDCAMVFFHQELRGGYGWIFPTGSYARAGVAVDGSSGVKPLEALKWFITEKGKLGLIGTVPLNTTGGAIPVGGPLKCQKDNILLAGDAAGLCHAQTGAGIITALESGTLAGSAAASYINGESSALTEYASEIEELLWPTLRHAVACRRALMKDWDKAEKEFCRTLRRTWVAFPEYRDQKVLDQPETRP